MKRLVGLQAKGTEAIYTASDLRKNLSLDN